MKKRIYLMRRNFRIAWLLLCLPLHLCIMAAWNGFRLKGNIELTELLFGRDDNG